MHDAPISASLFADAQRVIPGGVNSPVRAFKSVGGTPLFIDRAEGATLWDADGQSYVDYVGSWGPMLYGHAFPPVVEAVQRAASRSTSFGAPTKAEIDLASLVVSLVPSVEKVRFVNSGTEATMSAVRLARGVTGRPKLIKFAGHYHGHADFFLIQAGSGAVTHGTPTSPGVTPGNAADTLVATFNDLDSVRALFEAHSGDVACLIVEPIAGNMGCVPPEPGFLQGLRDLCDAHGALLIFDEVMTGFRVSPGGAQWLYGVMPDLTTLGKIIGGGLPVGAYGGRAEIMDYVSPQGPVYQAGTLSGNPLAMEAGLALLGTIANDPGVYDRLGVYGAALDAGLNATLRAIGRDLHHARVGSMATLFFTDERVTGFDAAQRADTAAYGRYFHAMLDRGVYLAPSAFEAAFWSAAHTEADLDATIRAQREALEIAFDDSIPVPTSVANAPVDAQDDPSLDG